ncbi:hypothetical protein K2X89_12670, partial [Myxococcota bacterium]|nr:hypothetical protein [Myxococcota bacterium]
MTPSSPPDAPSLVGDQSVADAASVAERSAAFAETTAKAQSELGAPDDPEVSPPLPASAVVASALGGLLDRLARPIRAASAEIGEATTREILRLAWPVMASQVLVNLTGLIDRMMIGRL